MMFSKKKKKFTIHVGEILRTQQNLVKFSKHPYF